MSGFLDDTPGIKARISLVLTGEVPTTTGKRSEASREANEIIDKIETLMLEQYPNFIVEYGVAEVGEIDEEKP